jgi:hypothetical protein
VEAAEAWHPRAVKAVVQMHFKIKWDVKGMKNEFKLKKIEKSLIYT